MTDFRALCAELLQELEHASAWDYQQTLKDQARAALAQPEPQGPTNAQVDELAAEYLDGDRASVRDFARAVLTRWWGNSIIAADGPAVPHGREPASVADQPTDKELLELMPENMRDEFAAVSDVYSTATGGQVTPGLFRVVLNTVALEYAQAVLQRYGHPVIEPVPVAKRLPGPGDCDADGRCWLMGPKFPTWDLNYPPKATSSTMWAYWLPAHALPIPRSENVYDR